VITEQVSVQGVLDTQQIERLPINGRKSLDLAQLQPGIQIQDGGKFDPNQSSFPWKRSSQFKTFGSREISVQPAHGRPYQFKLQPPVGAQEPDEPPFANEAKVEIFSSTLRLPQIGQATSETELAFHTSFSNSKPHSRHSNSKMGITVHFIASLLTWTRSFFSVSVRCLIVRLDASGWKR
jgi:hypothetical protein